MTLLRRPPGETTTHDERPEDGDEGVEAAPEQPEGGEAPSDTESRELRADLAKPRRSVGRFAPLLLLAGAFAVASMVLPHVPRERHIELRVADAPTVTGVELSWTAQGAGEAALGSAWHFAAGQAPASLEATVSLPDGRYELDVTIERAGTRASHHRSLTMADADRIAIPIP